jgi:hypothetical protein
MLPKSIQIKPLIPQGVLEDAQYGPIWEVRRGTAFCIVQSSEGDVGMNAIVRLPCVDGDKIEPG